MFRSNALRALEVAAVAIAIVLTGCGGGDGDSGSSQAGGSPTGNSAPTITGSPGMTVLAGQKYSFQPVASDPNGDALSFSASNLPSWGSLDAATGRLSGVPGLDQVGTYPNISISVTDGSTTVSLHAFSITVTATGSGSATVSWAPPTENEDGSALTDLASYLIVYGRSVDDLSLTLPIPNPSVSSYVVENLTSGAWYFAVVAVNAKGVSSNLSAIGSKTIS